MARATFVKAARKDYPQHGIKAGESYYWWKFRFGGKHFSKTPPKRSQLTQSNFYGQLYEIQDRIAGLMADESLPDEVADIAEELRSLASECEDNRSNMPYQLQDSDTGALLEERAQALNDAADALEQIDFDQAPEDEPDECDACNGSGETMRELPNGEVETEPCDECNGEGTIERDDPSEYWAEKLTEVQDVDVDAS